MDMSDLVFIFQALLLGLFLYGVFEDTGEQL